MNALPMTRRNNTHCALCESSSLASICASCVNYRLIEYNSHLKSLKSRRDALYSRLDRVLVAKDKADDQRSWIILENEKVASMREKLRHSKEELKKGKAKIENLSRNLKVKYELLDSARSVLEKNRLEQIEKFYANFISQNLGHIAITSERLFKQSVIIKQICKLFPLRWVDIEADEKGFSGHFDTICNARLPRGLDPHSVPTEELAASLGYMVQLLNLVAHAVCAPALHNSGFAGSCSRIWQRDSYWDARPSSRSEYPLFIPWRTRCNMGENSWSDKSSSNFGVASVESVRKPHLDSAYSFNATSASPHSIEKHKDLQKGISLLKKSVACITAYCYNSLRLDVPTEASTFEAFARLLVVLSSSKEMRYVCSLKAASSRPSKQVPQLNKSASSVDSGGSLRNLVESAHAFPTMRSTTQPARKFNEQRDTKIFKRNVFDNNIPSSAASFLFPVESSDDTGRNENIVEGWDLIEHPTFPPPPSETEDVEHWMRAMFTDATKK